MFTLKLTWNLHQHANIIVNYVKHKQMGNEDILFHSLNASIQHQIMSRKRCRNKVLKP